MSRSKTSSVGSSSSTVEFSVIIIIIIIIIITIPGDDRVKDKELEKLQKYQLLKEEIAEVWRMRKVIVVHVVIGALGAVSVNLVVHEANRRKREVGSYPENSIVVDSKDTKKSNVPVTRRKRETWDPW